MGALAETQRRCYRSVSERIGPASGSPLVRSSRRWKTRPEDQAVPGLMIMRGQQSTGSFALCVEDGGMEDLEVRKVYQVLPDREASREGYVRIIDESGEDYIYPSELFVPVKLPAAVVRRLRRRTGERIPAARRSIRRAG